LSKVLAALGMPSAFDGGRADFSGMAGSNRKLFLSAVLHKAFVEVNEEGTEAAAATAVGVAKSAPRAQERPRLYIFPADRPVLRPAARGSDGILFVGRVADPGP